MQQKHLQKNLTHQVLIKLFKWLILIIFVAGVNLETITERVNIRSLINKGDIREAMERMNDLNTEVTILLLLWNISI